MKFDVTTLTYQEIEAAFAKVKDTPFYISKLGTNVLVGIDVATLGKVM